VIRREATVETCDPSVLHLEMRKELGSLAVCNNADDFTLRRE
jgi:hypothetical protein